MKNPKLKKSKIEKSKIEHEKIQIRNFSNKEIPQEIIEILSLGLDHPVGGIPRKNTILNQFELFFSQWSEYAHNNEIDLIKVTEIKSLLFLEFLKFCNCSSDMTNITKLKNFIKNNDDIIFCVIDKSKDIAIYNKNDYIKKLDDIYDPKNFEKIPNNPLKSDLRDLKSLISEISIVLTKSDNWLICPIESIKRGYGLIKCHREGEPLRPIISGLNCLTSGSETYLLNLIKPIVSECKYVINSTRKFNEHFRKIKDNFDPHKFEICSFDASSLFTSINVKRTVNYIIKKIYSKVDDFFPITPETPKPPPKLLITKLFMDVLLKYNSFETLGGFYRQKSGVSMGGKLSSAMATIFVHMLEDQIITKYIKKGVISSYVRYVDDVFVIVKKGHKMKLLKEMNNFDKGLNWTIENMENNKLVFLDTQIVLENSKLDLYQYRKPNTSQVLTNYKFGVSPKSYKNGLISGEVFRAKNCTTSEKHLMKHLMKP